jgi:predicted outer membrane lipoprotein
MVNRVELWKLHNFLRFVFYVILLFLISLPTLGVPEAVAPTIVGAIWLEHQMVATIATGAVAVFGVTVSVALTRRTLTIAAIFRIISF